MSEGPPGLDKIGGVGHEDAIRWFLVHNAPGTSQASTGELQRYAAVTPEVAELAVGFIQLRSAGSEGVLEVTGARIAQTDEIVVEYQGVDGRDYEFRFRFGDDGRFEPVHHQRSLAGLDVVALPTSNLESGQRSALHGLFEATYEDASEDYLGDQVAGMSSVGLALDGTAIVGFYFCRLATAALPVIGKQRVMFAGLSCVAPGVRRRGVMRAVATAAMTREIGAAGAFGLQVSKLATPASLNTSVTGPGNRHWPPADDPFALYDHPTPTQIAAATALAGMTGAQGYDPDTGVLRGTGVAVGRPRVEPEVDASVEARFDPVDRTRGDTLLGLAWMQPPPPAWLD